MRSRKGAKLSITNDSQTPIPHIFYDVNVTLGDPHSPSFHQVSGSPVLRILLASPVTIYAWVAGRITTACKPWPRALVAEWPLVLSIN